MRDFSTSERMAPIDPNAEVTKKVQELDSLQPLFEQEESTELNLQTAFLNGIQTALKQ